MAAQGILSRIDHLLSVLGADGMASGEEKQAEYPRAEGADKQTFVELFTGTKMPIVGLGTWKSKPGAVERAVECAIQSGYRHIDCAHVYRNETEVGTALKRSIGGAGQPARKDIFITSKLWNSHHRPQDVIPALRNTLKNLQLDYLDLYLIHWPTSFKGSSEFEGAEFLFPRKEDGLLDYGDVVPLPVTWKAMEEAVELGLAKHIGISNFNHLQVDEILAMCKIQPAVNQCESHPYLNQEKLVAHCQAKKVVFEAYSPLGSPDRPWAKDGEPTLLDDPALVAVAERLGKTVAQLLIRYQVQRGCVVIPKSVTPSRIKANLEIWDFELSDDDMATVAKFERGWRACLPQMTLPDGSVVERDAKHPNYPFAAEY